MGSAEGTYQECVLSLAAVTLELNRGMVPIQLVHSGWGWLDPVRAGAVR